MVRRPIEIRCRYAPLHFLEVCVEGVSRAQLWHRVWYRSYDPLKTESIEYTDTILKLRGVHQMYFGPRYNTHSWNDGYKPTQFRQSDAFLWDVRRTRILDRKTFEQQLLEHDVDNIRFVTCDENLPLRIAAIKQNPHYILHLVTPPDEIVAFIFFKHPALLPLFVFGRASAFLAKLYALHNATSCNNIHATTTPAV